MAGSAHAGPLDDTNLKRIVAQQVAADSHKLVDPKDIKLMKVHLGLISLSTWEADTPYGHYVCSTDPDLVKRDCAKVDVEPALSKDEAKKP
jgi:hypothetical protein